MKLISSLILAMSLAASAVAAPIDSDKLFRPHEIQNIKLSPNTQYVLQVVLEQDYQRLYLSDMAVETTLKLIELPDEGTARILDFNWIDNDAFVLHYRARGYKAKALMELNRKGDDYDVKFRRIDTKGDIVSYLQQEPGKLLFSKDNRYTSRVDHQLFRIDLAQFKSGNFENAERIDGGLENALSYGYDQYSRRLWAFARDGNDYLIYSKTDNEKEWSKLANIDVFKNEFDPVGLIDDNTMVVISNETTDKKALLEFDLKNQKYGKVLYEHERYDLHDADMSFDGKTVRSVRYFDHGRLVSEHFNREDKYLQKQIRTAFPDKQFLIVDEKPGYEDKLVLAFSSDDPGAYYFFDRSAKQLKNIGERLPEVSKDDLSRAEEIKVTSKDGLPIEALLSRSKNPNGVLLVVPHGGPIGVQETQTFNRETQYLTSRGYAVLQVNFRGSSGYGKEFEQKGVGALGQSIEDDITAAVEHVRSQYAFDKMCAMGASYGGYSALMLAMRYPQDYQCAISAYGIYDLPFLYNASNFDLTEQMQKAIENTVGKDMEQLKAVSPFYMVEKLKVPFLLIAGKKDEIAWFEHSNRLKYRMQQLGVEFEHYFYPNVAHGHSSYFGDRFEMAAVDEFLRRHLKLPHPTNEGYQALLAAEYMRMGDAWNDGLLGDDTQKTFDWYLKGAELGDARGMFNVGAYYHRGELVDYDMKTAASWYEKSSAAGKDIASYRLGQLYRDGDLGVVDHQKSVAYFQKAQDQDHDLAQLELALAECQGLGIEQNVENCLSVLSVEKKDDGTSAFKRFKDRRWLVIAQLFWSENLKSSERSKLIDLVAKLQDIKLQPTTVELDNWGTYQKDYRYNARMRKLNFKGAKSYNFKHDDTTNQVKPGSTDASFGVRVDTVSDADDDIYTLVLARWTQPNVQNCQNIGQYFRYEMDVVKADDSGAYYIRNLDADWERLPFDWRIEVQDMSGNKVFDKVYNSIGGECKAD